MACTPAPGWTPGVIMLGRGISPFFLVVSVLAACGTARAPVASNADGDADAEALTTCTLCHGDAANGNAAPPRSLLGLQAETDLPVGAHQKHLHRGAFAQAIACSECHVVPASVYESGHIVALPARVVFGSLARTGGLAPAWDSSNGRCSATYCHGASLGGGSNTRPEWNQGAAQASCGTCHGLPPASPHPSVPAGLTTSCFVCHAGTVTPDGAILVDGGLHVNGTVDAAGNNCTSCHGNDARSPAAIAPAPPRDTRGNTATSAPGVGAHQAHLVGGAVRGTLPCDSCHVVPGDSSHAILPLDLTWGALARTGKVVPSWDASALTCTNYCHGASLGGGTNTQPVWNGGPSQAPCGGCHGLPPPAPHLVVIPGLATCAVCHPGTVGPDGTLLVAGGLHVNGIVDFPGGKCTSCHGDPGGWGMGGLAPPHDTHGNTATSAPGVGAHQAHLVGGAIRSALPCMSCHVFPTDDLHAQEPLNLTWSALASNGGVTPSWNATALTCSNYCHGASLGGGSNTQPVWNLGPSQAPCGSCHGLPPSTPHPTVTGGLAACVMCHPGTVAADGTILVAGGLHVNGTVEAAGGTCTSCHGDETRSPGAIAPAPPRDAHGNSTTTAAGVGAHQAHLVGGAIRGALPCNSCHVVPGDSAHALLPLDLTWGALARTGGTTPTWNGTSLTCTNYCHGASLGGGSKTQPVWNLGPSQTPCGSCHGLPPAAPHPAVAGGVTACVTCHPGTVAADGTILVAGGLHVNGVLDVSGRGCGSCHGDETRTPSLIAPAPPRDTHGNTATSAPGVGAHQAHLAGGAIRGGLPCNACHVVPGDSAHALLPLDLTWGALAGSGGVTPSWNGNTLTCTNYCHGASLGGGSNIQPVWNLGPPQAPCGSCHGLPPAAPHPVISGGLTACYVCHQGTVAPDGTILIESGLHVNGALEVSGTSCTSCHGDAARTPASIAAAPPRDAQGQTATSFPGVGAHQAHLRGTALGIAIACTECHTVPGDTAHALQPLVLSWGPLASAGGVTPSWNGTALTCTNYCHGATLTGGGNVQPVWNLGPSQASCGSCHGYPPPSGKHNTHVSEQQMDCFSCHETTSAYHLNGRIDPKPSVDWDPVARNCAGSCHGADFGTW